MSRYLVLNIDCAECRAEFETLVTVLGYADSLDEAEDLAKETADRHEAHTFLREWKQCESGWYAAAGAGEVHIVELRVGDGGLDPHDTSREARGLTCGIGHEAVPAGESEGPERGVVVGE